MCVKCQHTLGCVDVCVILVKTGIQSRKIADFVLFAPSENYWIPACAGMTGEGAGMTREGTGMTGEISECQHNLVSFVVLSEARILKSETGLRATI